MNKRGEGDDRPTACIGFFHKREGLFSLERPAIEKGEEPKGGRKLTTSKEN